MRICTRGQWEAASPPLCGLAPGRERLVPLGAAGFEPTASITPRWHATKLRYAPCLDSSIVHWQMTELGGLGWNLQLLPMCFDAIH